MSDGPLHDPLSLLAYNREQIEIAELARLDRPRTMLASLGGMLGGTSIFVGIAILCNAPIGADMLVAGFCILLFRPSPVKRNG